MSYGYGIIILKYIFTTMDKLSKKDLRLKII